jgi:hypothetical protein
MGLFSFLRRRKSSTPSATVSFDAESVTCRRPGGAVETVRWSDLRAVLIHTTDVGPAVDDVFWVLVGNGSGCVIPSEADGANRLLERLQQLPNFDYDAAIQAMSSTDNWEFLCWKRQDAG